MGVIVTAVGELSWGMVGIGIVGFTVQFDTL